MSLSSTTFIKSSSRNEILTDPRLRLLLREAIRDGKRDLASSRLAVLPILTCVVLNPRRCMPSRACPSRPLRQGDAAEGVCGLEKAVSPLLVRSLKDLGPSLVGASVPSGTTPSLATVSVDLCLSAILSIGHSSLGRFAHHESPTAVGALSPPKDKL